jgi:hypothetical protein
MTCSQVPVSQAAPPAQEAVTFGTELGSPQPPLQLTFSTHSGSSWQLDPSTQVELSVHASG